MTSIGRSIPGIQPKENLDKPSIISTVQRTETKTEPKKETTKEEFGALAKGIDGGEKKLSDVLKSVEPEMDVKVLTSKTVKEGIDHSKIEGTKTKLNSLIEPSSPTKTNDSLSSTPKDTVSAGKKLETSLSEAKTNYDQKISQIDNEFDQEVQDENKRFMGDLANVAYSKDPITDIAQINVSHSIALAKCQERRMIGSADAMVDYSKQISEIHEDFRQETKVEAKSPSTPESLQKEQQAEMKQLQLQHNNVVSRINNDFSEIMKKGEKKLSDTILVNDLGPKEGVFSFSHTMSNIKAHEDFGNLVGEATLKKVKALTTAIQNFQSSSSQIQLKYAEKLEQLGK